MENYEQKYKDLIARLQKAKENDDVCDERYCCVIDEIAPELTESEDERIRKRIYDYINVTLDDNESAEKEKWLACLEKQGEQKPADKVEPKFKVGDKIRRKTPSSFDKDMQVARIGKDYYVCNHIGKFSSEVVPFSKQSSYELIEQKPWSEEDDDNMMMIEDRLSDYLDYIREDSTLTKHRKNSLKEEVIGYVNWLKSLKDRVQPKQEWSVEDKLMLMSCIEIMQTADSTEGQQNWLKSLRPQNRWKPTDEQMDTLLSEVTAWTKGCPKQKVLESLYNDLKKLREEEL